MPFISASLDAFLLTSVAILLPTIYHFFTKRPTLDLHTLLSILLLIHTLYLLHALIVKYPPNLFQTLAIPLTTPSDQIRTMLLRLSRGEPLSDSLEALLTKLASYEIRTLYVRFGHDAVSSCDYCHSYSDYAFYVLPEAIAQYIRTALVVGVLTLRGSHKEHWRKSVLVCLTFCAVSEAWWINTVVVGKRREGSTQPSVGTDVTMWHDRLFALRHTLFLLLPPIVHLVLPARPETANAAQTLRALPRDAQRVLRKAHLLKYARGAIMREPELRERSASWWAAERERGEAITGDEDVRAAARRVGWGFDDAGEGDGEGEGALRVSARGAVKKLVESFVLQEETHVN